jgi:hypothetical protein
MTQNDTDKNLTSRQLKALEAIMSEPTIQAAAMRTGVERKTLYRWLDEPAFADALREARSQAFERTMSALAAAAEKAVEVLREFLDKEESSAKPGASVRIRAVRVALDSMLRTRDLIEVEERLKKLEEVLLQQGRL